MNLLNFFWISILVLTISSKTSACSGETGSVEKITCLADSLKATMSSSQLSNLELTYSYDNSRTWSNLPVTMQPRLGIEFSDLNAGQLDIAMAIVREISGSLANEGYDEAYQLFLADEYLSNNGGGSAYGANRYFLCFNGTPGITGTFSIKVGGHHLQIENTYSEGVMIGATPHFEAIEPLSFTDNGNTYSPIDQEKIALAAMFAALNATELSSAHLSSTFSDIVMGAKNNGSYKDWIFPETKVGIQVSTLSDSQKTLVLEAIATYVKDIDDVHSDLIMAQYELELDDTFIAYSGNANLSTQNSYARIDGPGVWIEFTVQSGIIFSGVHYHSIWRDHVRDYGGAGGDLGIQSTEVGSDYTSVSEWTIHDKPNARNFPNPVHDLTTIQYFLASSGNTTIRITDSNGRIVHSIGNIHSNQGDNNMVMDLSALATGGYVCEIDHGTSKEILQIIKE